MNETTDNFAFSRIERLEAPSGASIAFRHQPSALAPARGVLMICHGLVEHAGRYRRFADVMAKQGFEVYAQDHRGHGRTKAADAPLGRFAWKDGAEKVIADVMAMRVMIGERHPGLPVILFGHSMGGLVALNAAVSHLLLSVTPTPSMVCRSGIPISIPVLWAVSRRLCCGWKKC